MTITIDPMLQAQALSVQRKPTAQYGQLRFSRDMRSALLPPPGSRERERQLRLYRHNPYSTLFRSATAGTVKRVQTTPYIIRAESDYWQSILMQADFGDWARYISKTVSNYFYHDAGAWTELIAPGDPRFAPTGPIVGIAALDTLRVYPTGNPTYPAIYYDQYGKMHLMHHTRVVQMVDNEYSEEYLAGYGECAQTRAIVPIRREILLNQYIEAFLDDKPRPGIRIWTNIDQETLESAQARMEMDKKADDGGAWGNVIDLYSLDTATEAKLNEYFNAKAPEGFDFDKYKNEIALEMAAALGLDIQDFWQLTTAGGLGTSTQSEILAQKSRGKTFGNLLKRITRMINEAFPDRVEFSWEYRDPQEDQEEADKAQAWANTITILAPYLQPDEVRQLASNQIGALKDVLLDEDGKLRRLNDEDPEPDPVLTDEDGKVSELIENYVEETVQEPKPAPLLTHDLLMAYARNEAPTMPLSGLIEAYARRSFTDTGSQFSRYLRSFARVGQAHTFPAAIMRATFREELYNSGVKAYNDGVRDGGFDPNNLDADAQARRDRQVTEWLALQNPYVNNLVDEISDGNVSREAMKSRSDMWVSKSLRTIYYTGLHQAAGEQVYGWRLGRTEEHCQTCLTASNQAHKLKDWLDAGIYPGSHSLKCKGYRCDCRFQKSDGRARGRLPGGRQAPFASFTDRLGNFLRRLAGV